MEERVRRYSPKVTDAAFTSSKRSWETVHFQEVGGLTGNGAPQSSFHEVCFHDGVGRGIAAMQLGGDTCTLWRKPSKRIDVIKLGSGETEVWSVVACVSPGKELIQYYPWCMVIAGSVLWLWSTTETHDSVMQNLDALKRLTVLRSCSWSWLMCKRKRSQWALGAAFIDTLSKYCTRSALFFFPKFLPGWFRKKNHLEIENFIFSLKGGTMSKNV